jgi:hypothetical protein
MPRVRALSGREAGVTTRVVQAVFRVALGRKLNPYKSRPMPLCGSSSR